MYMRRAQLPENCDWERLAAPGIAKTLCRIFLGLPGAKNRSAQYEALRMKKFLLGGLVAAAVLSGMAGCAQIKKPTPQVKAAAVGLRFDQVGRVSLYAGEPCTPQIMFNFHSTRSTVWLAASRRETDILTSAANKNEHVHILGRWRRRGLSSCSYVQVTSAELAR